MTIMNTELYEALEEAGASDEKDKAASSVVEEQNKRFDGMDRRFDNIENRFIIMQKEIDHRFDKVDSKFELMDSKIDSNFGVVDNKIDHVEKRVVSELATLKWIGGIIIGGLVAVLAKLVFFMN